MDRRLTVPAVLIVPTNITSMRVTGSSVNFVVPPHMGRVALTAQPKNIGTEPAQNADGAAALRRDQGASIVRQGSTNIRISNRHGMLLDFAPMHFANIKNPGHPGALSRMRAMSLAYFCYFCCRTSPYRYMKHIWCLALRKSMGR